MLQGISSDARITEPGRSESDALASSREMEEHIARALILHSKGNIEAAQMHAYIAQAWAVRMSATL